MKRIFAAAMIAAAALAAQTPAHSQGRNVSPERQEYLNQMTERQEIGRLAYDSRQYTLELARRMPVTETQLDRYGQPVPNTLMLYCLDLQATAGFIDTPCINRGLMFSEEQRKQYREMTGRRVVHTSDR